MKIKHLLASLLVASALGAALAETPVVLPLRQRAELRDRWIALRLQNLVVELMRREGIDLWIVAAREYNEDPVIRTMLPSTWMAARRRTILLLYDPGEGGALERLAVARYDIGDFFKRAWDPEREPDQWKRLSEIIRERNPKRIALDYSPGFALADGLSHSEFVALREALPPEFQERVVSAERLAIGWLETRLAEEMEVYPTICAIAHAIIAEGLSAQVIQPGHTTTEDVEWWFRERIAGLKLSTWFHPSVSIQRDDDRSLETSFASHPSDQTIRRGDLLHVDFGISYLGLNTDTQQHAYVLRSGENEAPAGLQRALAVGNRLQDILAANFQTGRTGNEILSMTLEQARREELRPSVYTHPIGFHGHAAGPTIGLWDQQGGVPVNGDYPLYPNTAYSIELNVTETIPEWNNREIRIMLEEDAFFDGKQVRYIDGRQTRLLLIR